MCVSAPLILTSTGCKGIVILVTIFCWTLCLSVGGTPFQGQDMFEAKPRAVEKKESSTETGSVTVKRTLFI